MMASLSSSNAYADLQVISYKGLVAREPETLKLLSSACKEDGFFYLDLTEPPKSSFLQIVSKVMTASHRLFDLPLVDKMGFDTNKLRSLGNYG